MVVSSSVFPETVSARRQGRRKKRAEAVRKKLTQERICLLGAIKGRRGGLEAAATLAGIMDELLRESSEGAGDFFALLAVGGYGRGLLAPFSDIDLLFLVPEKMTAREKGLINDILYPFWDAGLAIGYAVNTAPEARKRAQEDHQARTALLDARFLYGNAPLHQSFIKDFKTDNSQPGAETVFVRTKLEERNQRHIKRGDSRYLLEPNIKENKGGLRDLDTLHWIISFLAPAGRAREGKRRAILTRMEHLRLDRARQFIWTVRWHLHSMAGRKDENLTFDSQIELARNMGYRDQGGRRGVERFMSHYFLMARNVGHLTRTVCAALDHLINPEEETEEKLKSIEGFSLKRKMLSVSDPNHFRRNPGDCLRIFHLAARKAFQIHPETVRALSRNARHLTAQSPASLTHDKALSDCFIEILSMKKIPPPLVSLLNDTGVLSAFIPDFRHLVGQMQFDMYHVYTTDEHTLHALVILNEIEQGLHQDKHPLVSDLVHKIPSREVLYIALFLHDIGKGLGGNHSEKGADIATRLCPKMGFSQEDTTLVAWLVRHHLLMSQTAFRRDLNEMKTIEDFASIVCFPERLRLLLCLTVADIRGVGPDSWTGWKAGLLRDLYQKSHALLIGPGQTSQKAHPEKIGEVFHNQLLEKLNPINPKWTKKGIKTFIDLHPPDRLSVIPIEQMARNITLLEKYEQEKTPCYIERKDDFENEMIKITLVTSVARGQMAILAGEFARAGLSIIQAEGYQLTDGTAFYHFYVSLNSEPERLTRLEKQLLRAIKQGAPSSPEGEKNVSPFNHSSPGYSSPGHSSPGRWRKAFRTRPHILVDNEASANHSVIEVTAQDRSGLLYDLLNGLDKIDIRIDSTKIDTYGERVIDIFYVKNIYGLKITTKSQKEQVQKTLGAIVEAQN